MFIGCANIVDRTIFEDCKNIYQGIFLRWLCKVLGEIFDEIAKKNLEAIFGVCAKINIGRNFEWLCKQSPWRNLRSISEEKSVAVFADCVNRVIGTIFKYFEKWWDWTNAVFKKI